MVRYCLSLSRRLHWQKKTRIARLICESRAALSYSILRHLWMRVKPDIDTGGITELCVKLAGGHEPGERRGCGSSWVAVESTPGGRVYLRRLITSALMSASCLGRLLSVTHHSPRQLASPSLVSSSSCHDVRRIYRRLSNIRLSVPAPQFGFI